MEACLPRPTRTESPQPRPCLAPQGGASKLGNRPAFSHDTVLLLGAGGHASVVVDALLCSGWPAHGIVAFDDRAELAGTLILGCRIETPVPATLPATRWVHASVGDNATRRRLYENCGMADAQWLVVRHPAAVLAHSAHAGAGSFFAAQSVTGPNVSIGHGVVVNHGAVVDHDCQVGHFTHIAPRASLGGGVRVGHGVLVGAGAIVLPGLAIGDRAVIGAGAVVLSDVAPGTTVAGSPAKPLHERKPR